jgi:hypothetical protein
LVKRFYKKWGMPYLVPIAVLGIMVLGMFGILLYDQSQDERDKYSVYTTADKDNAVVISDGEVFLVDKLSVSGYKESGTVLTYQESWSNDDNNNDVVAIVGGVLVGLIVLIALGMCFHQEKEVDKMEEEWHKQP